MLTVRYGISRKEKKGKKLKIVTKNGKLEYSNNKFVALDDNQIIKIIKEDIKTTNPGWSIMGFDGREVLKPIK